MVNLYYNGVLQDLKRRDGSLIHDMPSLGISNKSFSEINMDAIRSIPDGARKEEPWSSQYDEVTRSPFARDVGHLETLLDALVHNKNFERAENILHALYPLLDKKQTMIFSINKYLEAYSMEERHTVEDVDRFVESILKKFIGVNPDDRTFAIQIAKNKEDGKYMDIITNMRENGYGYMIKKVFSHIDILGDELATDILCNEGISRNDVPKEWKSVYDEIRVRAEEEKSSEVRNDMEDQNDMEEHLGDLSGNENIQSMDTTDSIESVTSLDKDASNLMAVDSFGLKVVRYTLLGLKTDSNQLQEFVDNLQQDLDVNVLGDNSSRRDYFDIYKSLETDEQRSKFNEVLELFNEERQKQLESKGVDAAREKWKHEYEDMKERGTFSMQKSLNVQLFKWYTDMLPYVEQEVVECQKLLDSKDNIRLLSIKPEERQLIKDRLFYAPYLTLVPPKKMCVIAILELLKLNSTGGIVDGMRTARAVVLVGKAVELEYKSQKLLKVEGNSKLWMNKKNTHELKKYLQRKRDVKYTPQRAVEETEWTGVVHAKAGEVLTRLLMYVAKVPVNGVDPTTGANVTGLQPAFHHTFQFMNGQKLGVLKIHKSLIKQLAGDNLTNAVQPQLLPMLVPPRPWTSYAHGGFLYSQNYLVRIKDSAETTAYLKASSEKGHLDQVYQGLNVLGETAWSVNRKVFEVISAKWNTGEKFLDIPDLGVDPKLPPAPPKNADPHVKRDYQQLVRKLLNEAAGSRSQRCDSNYKLEIARAFLGEKIYFPHNVDFRGRAYPLSPHFNHLGNDMTRSLFLFWEGRKLGERGLEWLKIHLANLAGLDKKPLNERLQYTNDNLETIFACARDPLSESGSWWLKADKPWQALAVCFELEEAYKLENPADYVSHIPVHQDGTCNGLQHYAALGGDVEGARQVNLLPSDAPQDVYKFVAGLVQKRIDKEAEEGEEYAKFIQDKITRKVVKQTVMTNVYGVTFVGAVAQIEKQIEHFFTNEEKAANAPGKVSRYLTNHVFASMRELFEGAHQIQDWLGLCAKRISKSVRIDHEDNTGNNTNKPSHLSSVIWTTPLGLPCVQPYRSTKKQIISTNLQDIVITDPFGAAPVDARKQQAAFPPNFVHSLDATHMLLTAAACGKDGIAFASVHDSYWTHAADVDLMNNHCRSQFINLHEDNLILKLRSEFERRYRGCLQLINIPGDHEVAVQVKDVRRNIVKRLGRALTVADEVYLEQKRQQLLDSDDPAKVQMGREMVTTVSVTEGHGLEELNILSAHKRAMQILIPLKFPEIPERGDLDIKQIKESKYFFS